MDAELLLANWAGTASPQKRRRAEAGLTTLLHVMAKDDSVSSDAWRAYMLATAEWETAGTFAPVREADFGRGKPYGGEIEIALPDGRHVQNIYYGRGYVQLTWRDNYARIGRLLGLGEKLEQTPDLAMQPDIAYRIFSGGMQHGWFTGVGLAHFLNDERNDFVAARRIINGTDHAEEIAQLATAWEQWLSSLPSVQGVAYEVLTMSLTSTLPRTAFEYGQPRSASPTSLSAVC